MYGKYKRLITNGTVGIGNGLAMNMINIDKQVDLRKRIQYGCWKPISSFDEPGQNTLALVFRNCIYIYNNKTNKTGFDASARRILWMKYIDVFKTIFS